MMPLRDDVNWRDLESVKKYARKLRTTYGLVIIWNGVRYQVKHEASKQILLNQGWGVVAEIPGHRDS